MSDDTELPAAKPTPAKPRRRSVGPATIAIIVALIALALAAWSTWQLTRTRRAAATTQQQSAAQLANLEAQLAAGDKHALAGDQRLGTLESNLDDVRSSIKALGLRTSNLETAVSNLSGQQQSAHDAVLLNDVEMLLRSAQQRYELFHDSNGALKAYTQAIAVLGQVQDPAYAPVRASAITERDALAAAAPPSRQAALNTLSALRGEVAKLPLASAAGMGASAPAKPGFWSRIAHSFSGIVRVSRDNGPDNAPPADAAFARQALALDLAQAQEALLAFDPATSHAALARAGKLLAAQFDGNDASVKAARAQIEGLLVKPVAGTEPQLGGALAELRSVRASQPSSSVPASASSVGSKP